jgi:hypothetical protein
MADPLFALPTDDLTVMQAPPVLLPPPGGDVPVVVPEPDLASIDPSMIAMEPDIGVAPAPVVLPSPALSDIERAQAQVVGGARDIEQATGQLERLRGRGQELAAEALATQEPEERQQLGERLQAIGEAGARIDQERAATRAAVQRSAVELQGASEVAAAEATAAAARDRAARSQELRDEFAGREAQRAEREATAREQFDADRAEARRVMQSEPGSASWQSVIEIIGETMRADRAGDVPRYGDIVARAMAAGRQRHQDKVRAAMAKMELTGDELQRVSMEQSELRAVESAERAAIFDAVEERLTAEIATIQEPMARAQAAQRLDGLRQERAAAEAAAVRARNESELKRRKAMADIGLVEAKTATERAREAKLARRGRGVGRGVTPGLVPENVVTIPGTDQPLVTFADDARGRSEAKATRDIVGEQQSFLEVMNAMEAFYEDAEKQGLLSSIGVRGSDANERLEALRGVAAAKLAQIKAGPGKATTTADEDWAEQFLPANPKMWTNKGRGMRRLQTATSVFEDESRSLLGRTTRLDTATRERVVREARKRSVSQTQRARTLASKAAQTVGDKTKDAATRVKAVQLVEENARLQAQQQGGDWLELATAQTTSAIENVDDPTVLAAATKQLARYRRLARDRTVSQRRTLYGDAYAAGIQAGARPRTDEPAEIRRQEAIQARVEKAGRSLAKRQLSLAGEELGAGVSALLGLD